MIDDKVVVTDFLKYESLIQDLKSFSETVGITPDLSLFEKIKIHDLANHIHRTARITKSDLSPSQAQQIKDASTWLYDFYE